MAGTRTRAASTTTSSAATTTTGVTTDRALLHGRATLDGHSFESRFVGAVVINDGLVTPCNVTIPAIVAGRFALGVYTERSSVGCGRPRSRVVLWTYVGAEQLFSTQAFDWPAGGAATVSADFSTTDPSGAAPRVLELSGEVHRPDGSSVPAGARVEALIGTARCGVASVMDYGGFVGYVLYVVGPDSIPACRSGAVIKFRVDGSPTVEFFENLGKPPRQFNLTQQ